MAEPTLPYLDRGACPFEGCSYREWTARNSVLVYDTWEEKRQPIARISVGEKVTGITGVVITFQPGSIRVDRDLPDQGLKRGDILLTYTYLGEGFSNVWFKGRFYTEFDISFAKWPDGSGCGNEHCAAIYTDLGNKSWWAQVKLSSGRMGRVEMGSGDFDGIDQLAGLPHSIARSSRRTVRSKRDHRGGLGAVLHGAEPSGREVVLAARQQAIRLGVEHVHQRADHVAQSQTRGSGEHHPHQRLEFQGVTDLPRKSESQKTARNATHQPFTHLCFSSITECGKGSRKALGGGPRLR